MVVKLGNGQCGGHVTLLFAIADNVEALEQQVSLVAGLCLKDGIAAISRG